MFSTLYTLIHTYTRHTGGGVWRTKFRTIQTGHSIDSIHTILSLSCMQNGSAVYMFNKNMLLCDQKYTYTGHSTVPDNSTTHTTDTIHSNNSNSNNSSNKDEHTTHTPPVASNILHYGIDIIDIHTPLTPPPPTHTTTSTTTSATGTVNVSEKSRSDDEKCRSDETVEVTLASCSFYENIIDTWTVPFDII